MPNILITGTPGTGKTTLSSSVASLMNAKHVEVSRMIQEHELHDGRDEEFDCFIFNDDKVLDYMEDVLLIDSERNYVVDFHGSDFFPERWFDMVVVLRADTTLLFDRLMNRGYSELKVNENIQSEIFQVCLDEALESYNPDIILQLQSNTSEDMQNNIEKITHWIKTGSLPQ